MRQKHNSKKEVYTDKYLFQETRICNGVRTVSSINGIGEMTTTGKRMKLDQSPTQYTKSTQNGLKT